MEPEGPLEPHCIEGYKLDDKKVRRTFPGKGDERDDSDPLYQSPCGNVVLAYP